MPWQTYDPKTGTQTTYKGESADTGVAKVEQINSNFQPAPATTPVAPTTTTPTPTTPAPTAQTPSTQAPTAAATDVTKTGVDTTGAAKKPAVAAGTPGVDQGIEALVTSGRAFNEIDAKNYAHSKGEANYQQYINGVGGKANPLYIGATNWASLQKQYTPYQLSKATTNTKDGIYWNPAINIGQVPKTDPSSQINKDAKTISNIVTDAKNSADKTTKDEAKDTTIGATADETQTNLDNLMGTSKTAEATYNELYNTPEMKAAQADVLKYKANNDKYDQQIDELKNDIRKEVEGEAPDSYVNALAAVRGDQILKLKRANQRDLDTATAQLTGLKENAANLLQVRTKDTDTRYNQLFQMLQLQIQQEGTAFNQETAIANITMNLPENRSITIAGTTYKGLKENDNLNVVQFTDAAHNTYVIGVDKKTGKQVYKQLLGKSPAGGGSGAQSATTILSNYKATEELNQMKEITEGVKSGNLAKAFDDKGNPFYYDKKAYDAAVKDANTKNNDWDFWGKNNVPVPTVYEFQKY